MLQNVNVHNGLQNTGRNFQMTDREIIRGCQLPAGWTLYFLPAVNFCKEFYFLVKAS